MNQLTVALIVVIGLMGGFYGGLKYGQNNPPRSANNTAANAAALTGAGATGAGGGTGARGAGAGTGGTGARGGGVGGFGGAISGQITAVGNGTITLHETTGQDVTVNVSAARITQTSQGTTADLTPSTQVTVTGPTGSDGTVNATLVAIGGLGGGGLGRGQQAASPSPGG